MGSPTRRILGVGVALAITATLFRAPDVQASDHDESPIVKGNAALDITDVYVFDHAGNTVLIVCWAGFTDDTNYTQPTTEGVFVPDVLYTLNIDNNNDNVADHKIYWRYSSNEVGGKKGIEWFGIPDAAGAVVHPVEEVYTDDASGAQLWTGHADDPFFFDALGYLTTLDSAGLNPAGANLSFDSTRDFLAGLNVTAAVIEIDQAKLGAGAIQVWATASEKP
jgi:uncharacterized protein DUF4331